MLYLKPEGTPFGRGPPCIGHHKEYSLELRKVSWRSTFSWSRSCGDQTQLYKEKESEKRAWNARYALHNKYPWDVGLGKLVPLTIPVLPIRETMTRSLPVYVHTIAKTKTNHVLVILIIAGCRSLRHVLSFVKPLERRLDYFPLHVLVGFVHLLAIITCPCSTSFRRIQRLSITFPVYSKRQTRICTLYA